MVFVPKGAEAFQRDLGAELEEKDIEWSVRRRSFRLARSLCVVFFYCNAVIMGFQIHYNFNRKREAFHSVCLSEQFSSLVSCSRLVTLIQMAVILTSSFWDWLFGLF